MENLLDTPEEQTRGEPSSADFRLRKIVEIKTMPPFEGLFPIAPETLEAVKRAMKEGYDRSQPIVIWQGRDIVIDGHTRLKAAKVVGFAEIPVHEAHFDDEDAALEYAIHNQRDRRNIADAELARLVQLVDKPREPRRDDKGKFTVGSSGQGQELSPEPPMQTGHRRQLFPGKTRPLRSIKS